MKDITAEKLAALAAQLKPKPGGRGAEYPFDIEFEEIVIGETSHWRVHAVFKGRRGMHSNFTAGPVLDHLKAQAKRLGFRVIETPAAGRKPA